MRKVAAMTALVLAACAAPAPEAEPVEVSDAERLGMSMEDARGTWDSLGVHPYSALVYAVDCSRANEACRVQVRGAAWNSLPRDSKRDIATGIGRAGVVSQGVRHVNFVDMHSGADLATFSGPRNSVRMD